MKDVGARKLDHLFSELMLVEADAARAVRLLSQVERCDLPCQQSPPSAQHRERSSTEQDKTANMVAKRRR